MGNDVLEKFMHKLQQLYKKFPFSVGLHTTDEESAKQIMNTGLNTGARALEGTIKFRGDLSDVVSKDFDYFFPYTDSTVIVLIPKNFNAPRIEDNLGGDKPISEFSQFFENAQVTLPHYKNGIEGVLPNYYILGYYDKDYNLTFNPDCMIFNNYNYKKFSNDLDKCEELSFLSF